MQKAQELLIGVLWFFQPAGEGVDKVHDIIFLLLSQAGLHI